MRLKYKVLLLTVIPLAIVLFITGGLTIYNKIGTERELLLNRLSSYSVLLQSGDLSFETAADKDKLEAFFNEKVEFSEILGRNYNVIYSSENSPIPLIAEDEKKEIDAAFQGYETTKNIVAKSGRKTAFVIISPLVVNNRVVAVLHQGLSNEKSTQRVTEYAAYIVAFIMGGIILCIFLISFLSSRVVLKNISALKQATIKLQEGNFNTKIDIKSNDEIGVLADSFNGMAHEILLSKNLLEKHQRELESQVAKRTKELNSKLNDLIDTRTAVLNILEDVNASKEEIETSRAKLLKLNNEKEKANAELKRMDTYKNEFISTTAHELKTPLASIHGFASLLQNSKTKSNIKQRDYYLSIIMQDADRLKKLIDDILDLSRLDLGTMKFVFDNVNVRESFKDVVKEMYIIAANKGLTLKADVENPVPQTIVADKSRFNQVLINLVNNAVKYTDTEKKKGKKITLLARRKGSYVLFSVADQGVGIAKKDYNKLFRRFSQIDSSYTRKVGGTGLGLAISKGIVHALGGRIWMKSELGKGTTFYFTLPMKSRLASSAEADLSVLGTNEPGKQSATQNGKQQSDGPKNIALNGVNNSASPADGPIVEKKQNKKNK